jgi:hypothetical protein
VFFVFCLFLSSLVWFFLWLPEEELTLLFLLHLENGDFSILMRDIICSKFDVGVSDIVQRYCSGVF